MSFHHRRFLYKFESDLPWGEPIGVVTMYPLRVAGAGSTQRNAEDAERIEKRIWLSSIL